MGFPAPGNAPAPPWMAQRSPRQGQTPSPCLEKPLNGRPLDITMNPCPGSVWPRPHLRWPATWQSQPGSRGGFATRKAIVAPDQVRRRLDLAQGVEPDPDVDLTPWTFAQPRSSPSCERECQESAEVGVHWPPSSAGLLRQFRGRPVTGLAPATGSRRGDTH